MFWNLATAQELFSVRPHSSLVARILFSPDGQLLVTGQGAGPGRQERYLWPAPRE